MRLSESVSGNNYRIIKMEIPPLSNTITNGSAIKVVAKEKNQKDNRYYIVFHCAGERWSIREDNASKIWIEEI